MPTAASWAAKLDASIRVNRYIDGGDVYYVPERGSMTTPDGPFDWPSSHVPFVCEKCEEMWLSYVTESCRYIYLPTEASNYRKIRHIVVPQETNITKVNGVYRTQGRNHGKMVGWAAICGDPRNVNVVGASGPHIEVSDTHNSVYAGVRERWERR